MVTEPSCVYPGCLPILKSPRIWKGVPDLPECPRFSCSGPQKLTGIIRQKFQIAVQQLRARWQEF